MNSLLFQPIKIIFASENILSLIYSLIHNLIMISISKQFGLALLLVGIAATSMKAQNPSGIHLIKKTVIGGTGGWDYVYVDADNRRLYVSHGTQVEVLNADTHEKVGVIEDTKGVHGIVTANDAGKGFVTCGGISQLGASDVFLSHRHARRHREPTTD